LFENLFAYAGEINVILGRWAWAREWVLQMVHPLPVANSGNTGNGHGHAAVVAASVFSDSALLFAENASLHKWTSE